MLGYYFTGDGTHRYDGIYYQITGRMDDVINVSGHRLGTAEIEDAMVRFLVRIKIKTVRILAYIAIFFLSFMLKVLS